MIRVLSRPLPFPYTTLFRSRCAVHIVAGGRNNAETVEISVVDGIAPRFRRESAHAQRHDIAMLRRRDAEQDRKSTRLNSSHLGISYAVFCFKKKTQSNSWMW